MSKGNKRDSVPSQQGKLGQGGKLPVPDMSAIMQEHVSFSFKYLDLSSNPKFCPDRWWDENDWIPGTSEAYFQALMDRLRDVSGLRVHEFMKPQASGIRSHRIDWAQTSEPDGFTNLNEQLRDEEARQFSLSSNKYGRVHGFMIDTCFCVVWFDPYHRLYP